MGKAKKTIGVTICSGCIKEFKNIELTIVSFEDTFGLKYTSVFCEKCIKDKNYPQHKEIIIIGPAAKPRKQRTKKKK